MKLLFAIKTLTPAGGAEKVFCTLISELASRGHEVITITFDQPGSPAFYGLNQQIRRIDLGVGNSTGRARILETMRRVIELRKIVVKEQPHIAVGFMISMFVPLALAMIGLGIPMLGSEHIVPEYYRTRRLEYALFILVSPLMNKVTVLSEGIRASYPLPIRQRMIVIPNPISAPHGKANPGINKPHHVLLTVGRLNPQKDHATLLRAFAEIADAYPDWELKIIGEGALRQELEGLAKSLDLCDRIRMPGITRDIGTEYRNADVFVLSSRFEAFGLVTAEAMSYGLPVVGFADCPGTNELIDDGHTGLLVPRSNDRHKALAQALMTLLSNAELRVRLGTQGKSVISHKAAPEVVCDHWETILTEIATQEE